MKIVYSNQCIIVLKCYMYLENVFDKFKFVCKGAEDAFLLGEYAEELSDMVKINQLLQNMLSKFYFHDFSRYDEARR